MTFTYETRVAQEYRARTKDNEPRWLYTQADFDVDAEVLDLDDCVTQAVETAEDLNRKFDDGDVEAFPFLAPAAVAWLMAEERSFEYLVEMRKKWTAGEGLSLGQVRGVLNCLRAGERRAVVQRLAEEAPFTERFPRIVEALHRAKAHAQDKLDGKRGRASASILLPVGDTVVKISVAGDSSRYPGDLHVAERPPVESRSWHQSGSFRDPQSGAYYGRILRSTGEVTPALQDNDTIMAVLRDLEADPSTKIREYSRVMGQCAICGRALTNKISIERGIGPVCADRVGW